MLSSSKLDRTQLMAQSVAPSVVVLDLGDAEIKLDNSAKEAFQYADNETPGYVVISRRDDVST